MIHIYARINNITKKCYIGQTSQIPEKRWNSEKREKTYLGNSLRKYGSENFTSKVLLSVNTIDEANRQESLLIDTFNLKKYGYNRRDGGNKGHFSEETIKKLSESHKGQKAWNRGIPMSKDVKDKLREIKNKSQSKPILGKHHSAETKEKLRIYRKTFKFSEEVKRKMSESGKLAWEKRKHV